MNKRKVLNFGLFAIVLALMAIAPMNFTRADDDYGLGLYNTPDLFEENAFLPAFDIWVNQSASSYMHLQKYGVEAVERGWTLRHLIFLPPGAAAHEWKILDHHFFETVMSLGTSLTTEDNDAGYGAFTDRDVDTTVNYDLDSLGTEDVGTVITCNSDYIDDTSEPTASNITGIADESDNLWAAVKYEAGDGKSLNDYAEEAAENDGATFYNVVNATALGFSFDDYESLAGVQWNFDTPNPTMLSVDDADQNDNPQLNGVLKRIRIWLHKRKFQRKALSTTGGTFSTQDSAFKSISSASGLAQIPVGAKYFFSKTIGSAYYGQKTGVFAAMSGIKKAIVGLVLGYFAFSTIILIAIVFLLIKYRKELGKTVRSIFK